MANGSKCLVKVAVSVRSNKQLMVGDLFVVLPGGRQAWKVGFKSRSIFLCPYTHTHKFKLTVQPAKPSYFIRIHVFSLFALHALSDASKVAPTVGRCIDCFAA